MNIEPTSIFREESFADQVEEFDLNTTQVLSDFCAFHLTQSHSQRPKQLAFTPLPQLIESILQDAITADGEHQVEIAHVQCLTWAAVPFQTCCIAARNVTIVELLVQM
jgi:hypothetical protein